MPLLLPRLYDLSDETGTAVGDETGTAVGDETGKPFLC
jgi:hypothetical protein